MGPQANRLVLWVMIFDSFLRFGMMFALPMLTVTIIMPLVFSLENPWNLKGALPDDLKPYAAAPNWYFGGMSALILLFYLIVPMFLNLEARLTQNETRLLAHGIEVPCSVWCPRAFALANFIFWPTLVMLFTPLAPFVVIVVPLGACGFCYRCLCKTKSPDKPEPVQLRPGGLDRETLTKGVPDAGPPSCRWRRAPASTRPVPGARGKQPQ